MSKSKFKSRNRCKCVWLLSSLGNAPFFPLIMITPLASGVWVLDLHQFLSQCRLCAGAGPTLSICTFPRPLYPLTGWGFLLVILLACVFHSHTRDYNWYLSYKLISFHKERCVVILFVRIPLYLFFFIFLST